jgi:hypothetical protein
LGVLGTEIEDQDSFLDLVGTCCFQGNYFPDPAPIVKRGRGGIHKGVENYVGRPLRPPRLTIEIFFKSDRILFGFSESNPIWLDHQE